MIRAIIFDMDGVLIDAKEWHYEALNRALSHFGYVISRAEHERHYDGLPTRKKLQMLQSHHGLPQSLSPLICELKQRYTMEIARASCRPNPHHLFALAALKTKGYRLGVASNSVRQSVSVMMERSGLSDFLDLQLSNEDVTHPKPNPEIYLRAFDHFRLPAAECLIVEDNEHGVQAARASGAHVYVVRDVHDVTLSNLLARVSGATSLPRAG